MLITADALDLFLTGLILTCLFVIISFKMLWYMMGTFIKIPRRQMHYTVTMGILDLLVFTLILVPFIYIDSRNL